MNRLQIPGRTAPVLYCDSVDSTNTQLKMLAAEGWPEGTVLLAGQQTAGRGRVSRSFLSPPGGIYLSLLLLPDCTPQETLSLTPCTAVAAARALRTLYGQSPDIKWPNDLLLAGKKICGILCESLFLGEQQFLIIGLGLNVNTQAEDFPQELADIAGSLLTQTGRQLPLPAVARELITSLDEMLAQWRQEHRCCLEEYRRLCVSCDRPVRLIGQGTCREAYALSVADDYSLLVRLADGSLSHIRCGEISLR